MYALNLIHSPENGKVWVTADRIDQRASDVSVHVSGEWLTSPQVSDSLESNNSCGANLACREPLGHAWPEYAPSTSQERCTWGLCSGTGPGVAMKRLIPVE